MGSSARGDGLAQQPRSLSDVYDRSREAATTIFGADSYRQVVVDDGDLERDYSHIKGDFSLMSGGRLRVSRNVADRLRRFVAKEFSTHRVDLADKEREELSLVRDAALTLFKQEIRAVGPADSRLMGAEWESYWRYPYLHAFHEGVDEMAARMFLDRYLDETGLATIDRRIKGVPLPDLADVHFGAYTSAVRECVRSAIGITGGTFDGEVAALVRDGAGELALRRMSMRMMQAISPDAPSSLETLAKLRDVHDAVWGTLALIQKGWSETPDLSITRHEDGEMETGRFQVRRGLQKAVAVAGGGTSAKGALGSDMGDMATVTAKDVVVHPDRTQMVVGQVTPLRTMFSSQNKGLDPFAGL